MYVHARLVADQSDSSPLSLLGGSTTSIIRKGDPGFIRRYLAACSHLPPSLRAQTSTVYKVQCTYPLVLELPGCGLWCHPTYFAVACPWRLSFFRTCQAFAKLWFPSGPAPPNHARANQGKATTAIHMHPSSIIYYPLSSLHSVFQVQRTSQEEAQKAKTANCLRLLSVDSRMPGLVSDSA